ncbi:hypothetical protein D6745_03200 [Candidatus Woesearchaeota archaeon]|nr:MAG: hypothetical protein D6745_03200 [Candidatus Woesearchaeota archaeon]
MGLFDGFFNIESNIRRLFGMPTSKQIRQGNAIRLDSAVERRKQSLLKEAQNANIDLKTQQEILQKFSKFDVPRQNPLFAAVSLAEETKKAKSLLEEAKRAEKGSKFASRRAIEETFRSMIERPGRKQFLLNKPVTADIRTLLGV